MAEPIAIFKNKRSSKLCIIKSKKIMSHSRDQLEAWLKTIEINGGKVLDIGGSQLPVFNRLKRFIAEEYKILDLEKPHDCIQKPDIIADLNIKQDWFGINTPKELTKAFGYFDTAFCLEVSEYFYNPVQAIENIASLLKHGGTLYMSFHFITPVHAPLDQDCLRYTRNGAVKLLEKAGFKINDITKRLPLALPNMIGFYKDELGTKLSKKYNYHEEIGVLIVATKI